MIAWMGRDHHASLEERERLAGEWRDRRPEKSVFLLTCNRVELFYGDGPASDETARHLFRVTAGLESAIVGETAIQRQVKTAYLDSVRERRCPQGLHLLFQAALHAGKRVRTETGLSKGAPTHAQIAFRCIREYFTDLAGKRALLVGVNHLSRGIAKRFREAGVSELFIANRTYSRALEMSAEFNVRALRLEEVSAVLTGVDVLVTATSSPVPLFNRTAFPQQAKMLVVDLGVPRNVEEAVGALPGVKLLNIEEVEKMLDRDAVERREDIRVSQAILEEELSLFAVRKSGKTATFSRAS